MASLVLVAPTLVHLVINWDWALRVSTSFSRQLRKMNRVNPVVDIGLFFSTVTAMLSGFMVSRVISGFLGFSAPGSLVWHTVHSVSADVTIESASAQVLACPVMGCTATSCHGAAGEPPPSRGGHRRSASSWNGG